MDPAGQVGGQGPLAGARLRMGNRLGLDRLDLRPAEQGEHPQQAPRLSVLAIEPELVEGIRRRSLGIEPDRGPRRGLAEFRPARVEQQRIAQAVSPVTIGRLALDPPDQLQAGRDVAPLVGAAHLELDVEGLVELQEVRRLEEHVAELGVAQPGLEPVGDRILGQHVRDREVLADRAQEVEQLERTEPGMVVGDPGAGRAVEVEEALELGPDPGGIGHDHLAGQQVALGRGARRVADHARPAAHQGHRPAAVALEVEQAEDRDQVADMEGRPGRVEADVARDRARIAQPRRESGCRLLEQAAPGQFVEQAFGGGRGFGDRRGRRHSRRRPAVTSCG